MLLARIASRVLSNLRWTRYSVFGIVSTVDCKLVELGNDGNYKDFCFTSELDATMTLGTPVPSVVSSLLQYIESGSWMQEIDMHAIRFLFLQYISTSVTHYHILFVNKSHRPSYLQICSTSDFEMWMEIDIHHIFFISTIHLCIERQFSSIPSMHGFLAFCFPTLSLEQSDPTFKNRRAVLELCSEGEQSKLQHSFN